MCIHEQGRHLYIDLNLCYGDFRGRRLFTGRLQQQCLAIRRLQAPATTVQHHHQKQQKQQLRCSRLANKGLHAFTETTPSARHHYIRQPKIVLPPAEDLLRSWVACCKSDDQLLCVYFFIYFWVTQRFLAICYVGMYTAYTSTRLRSQTTMYKYCRPSDWCPGIRIKHCEFQFIHRFVVCANIFIWNANYLPTYSLNIE